LTLAHEILCYNLFIKWRKLNSLMWDLVNFKTQDIVWFS
jgi:hypothetical protein